MMIDAPVGAPMSCPHCGGHNVIERIEHALVELERERNKVPVTLSVERCADCGEYWHQAPSPTAAPERRSS